MTSHAGVFSASRLDEGARLLLDHFTQHRGPLRIVHPGCGNGALGVRIASDNPSADVTFIDESYRAIASAEATFQANVGLERTARFLVGNGMFEIGNGACTSKGSIDCVLNNPPFHESHAVSDAMASQMFTESRDVLRHGGELWVVGNRHLAYELRKGDLKKTDLTAAGYDQDRSFLLIEISGEELNFQTISRTGKTVDSGVIKRVIKINHAMRFGRYEQLLSA